MGLDLCFVYQTLTRPQAFIRGSSVFGVMVSMNNAAMLAVAAPAAAQTQSHTIQNKTIEMTVQEPRAYGPFGLGTVLNGDSNARLQQLEVQDLNSVPCVEEFTVCRETFCSVEANELRSHIPEFNIPTGVDRIYLKQGIQMLPDINRVVGRPRVAHDQPPHSPWSLAGLRLAPQLCLSAQKSYPSHPTNTATALVSAARTPR